ncbi:ribonuclease domain-containing protein [Anaerococcus tetradius]|uniref:ribonuclease domain-containing protein n=1 Tax=Anaerococcus tetradius TaxID=33036 RepID=UPI0023F0F71E|nr:ribonuclease domain-containing protein [Anaerococcus tetradius]
MKVKKYFSYLLILFLFLFSSCKLISGGEVNFDSKKLEESSGQTNTDKLTYDKDKSYYSLEDVTGYLLEYKKLPPNYLTKKQAQALGYKPREGNLWDVTDKGVIGGDYFGNYEEKLPKAKYREADVNYSGGRRGTDRIIYDEDFNIYYTKDHYKTFERIRP